MDLKKKLKSFARDVNGKLDWINEEHLNLGNDIH